MDGHGDVWAGMKRFGQARRGLGRQEKEKVWADTKRPNALLSLSARVETYDELKIENWKTNMIQSLYSMIVCHVVEKYKHLSPLRAGTLFNFLEVEVQHQNLISKE